MKRLMKILKQRLEPEEKTVVTCPICNKEVELKKELPGCKCYDEFRDYFGGSIYDFPSTF